MAKQTKITIQTDSVLLVRGRNSARALCPRCNADSEMVALEHLQVVSNLDPNGLQAWINSSELHCLKDEDGAPLICLNSLLAHIAYLSTD